MANTMELDEDEYLRNDMGITILELLYLRYRLDRKVAEYEEEKVKSVKRNDEKILYISIYGCWPDFVNIDHNIIEHLKKINIE